MYPEILALISGLIGALIGASASIITVVVQSRIQDKRERIKQATVLALEDYKMQLDISSRASGHRSIPPVTQFVDYHMRLAKALERGPLTPDSYKQVCMENEEIMSAIRVLNEKPNPENR